MSRTHTVEDWLDSLFNLRELLSLSEDELAQLEEISGDLGLTTAWWRRRLPREEAAGEKALGGVRRGPDGG